MATTMHAHIEVKIRNSWQHYSDPVITRADDLLAELSRGGEAVCRNQGLPRDANLITRGSYDENRRQGHCPHDEGWLDSNGLRTLGRDVFRKRINGGSVADHAGFEDARVVFWFEN